MIEIMCRDGGTAVEDLESAADVIKSVLNQDVEILKEEDHRAMVFWSLPDVKAAMKQMGLAESDLTEDELNQVLIDCEGELHQAMLDAGWDILWAKILETINN